MDHSKKPLDAFQAKNAAIAAAALQDPALIALLVDALAPALAKALRERAADVVDDSLLETTLSVGQLTIDLLQQTAHVNERTLNLTAREFALLVALARRPEQVFTREQLLALAWPSDAAEQLDEHSVDIRVHHVRRALGEAAPQLQTVRGTGYRLSRR